MPVNSRNPNSRRTRPRRKQRAARGGDLVRLPRAIHSWPPAPHPLRWSAQAASLSVTATNIMDAIVVAVTAVLGYQVYDAFRLKEVRAWVVLNQAVGGASTPATVSISFPGGTTGYTGSMLETNATSMSTTEPAFCSLRPDPKSGQALLQSNGGAVVFRVDQLAGGKLVVEADFEYRYNNDNAPTAATSALVGATPGQFYFRGLDGLAAAGTSWPSMLTPAI